MQHINPRELNKLLLQQAPMVLLDVREPWEYEICHISGSQLIPMRDIPQKINTLDTQSNTILICHHGMRSLQVAYFLEQAGFEKVFNLSGGIAAWAELVDPKMPTY
jgi:rhodanese-related sulfurtransferase